MNFKTLSKFFLLSVFTVSCRNEKEKINADNQQIYKAKFAGQVQLDSITPNNILIINEKLIILERYDYPFLKIYDLAKNRLVNEFGSKNDPIHPIENPFIAGRSFLTTEPPLFYLHDYKNNKIYNVEIGGNINGLKSAINLPLSFVHRYHQILKLSGNLYWGHTWGNAQEGKLFIHNLTANTTKFLPYLPETNREISKEDMPYFYYAYSSANNEKQRIASASKYFKRVEFYDFTGELKNVTVFQNSKDAFPNYKQSLVTSPDVTIYYNESYAGPKYFYAACVNQMQKDYGRNKGMMQIHVFDWEGNLKKIVVLDRMYLGSFAVDERNQKLYIISFIKKDQKNPILIYDLSNAAL